VLELGDRIEILASGDPGLNVVRTIEATGAIRLPGLGLVVAEGRTPSELASLLQLRAREVGEVWVRVLPPATRPVGFRGAVREAGFVPIHAELRLRDVLRAAQPTDAAELTEIAVYAYDGSVQIFDATTENPRMKSGDFVFVPITLRPNTALIVGGVARPGIVELREGMTLLEALGAVGGIGNHGDPTKIRITRSGEAPIQTTMEQAGGVRLRRGDTVQVELIADQAYATLSGNVRKPGMVPIRPGMTLVQLLEAAGGPNPGAGIDRILIRRAGGVAGNVTVDLRRVQDGTLADPEVRAGDVVEVPFGGIRPKPKSDLPKSGFPIPP
jgi:protein involved in polysaccharide export with SLBB domain